MYISIVIPVKDEVPEALHEILSVAFMDPRPSPHTWETIIVDDGSHIPFPPQYTRWRNPTPQGYGAALKKGIELSRGEYIVTCDGDGQHRWRDIQRLVEFVEDFPECDMVVGNRRLVELQCHRYIGRKCLNMLASFLAWQWLPDLNSGLRIVRASILKGYLPILCSQFSFTTSLTMAMLCDGYRVDYLPIRVLPRTHGRSHVQVFTHGWITLYYIIRTGGALRTRRVRAWLRPWWRWRRVK